MGSGIRMVWDGFDARNRAQQLALSFLGGAVAEPARATRPHAAEDSRAVPTSPTLGWLPALSLIGAVGLLLAAVADNGARTSAGWAAALFWVGLLTLYVPIAGRLVAPGASRAERVGLVALLGLGLYGIKLAQNPLFFTFYDELEHWRTLDDVVHSGHLFGQNPLLPVSPYFPGLENATSALLSLTGLAPFQAAILLIGAARLLLVLALYLLYEEVSQSAWIAGIASLLYMTNPNFVFFDAQFAYESLSLAFGALVLFALSRRSRQRATGRVGLTAATVVSLGALVVTHHLATYGLVAVLILWALVTAALRRSSSPTVEQPGSGAMAILALAVALVWLVGVASITLQYLAPVLGGALVDLLHLLAGRGGARRLFRDFTGQSSPLWEQLTGYSAVALILLGLPVGFMQTWKWWRANALAVTFSAAVIAYPLTLALRLTRQGLEVSNRTSEYLFLPIAFLLAVAVSSQTRAGPIARRWLAMAAGATILFMGGVILGWPYWARLPGPYLASADMRSIEPQGIEAAWWAREHLGPGNRVAADAMNLLLMGSYGAQSIVKNGDSVPKVFFDPAFTDADWSILRRWRVHYVVVDRRLSGGLPMVGVYYEQGEPGEYGHTTPIDPAALAKFDREPGLDRVMDSGDIAIYAVGGAESAP